MYIIHYIKNFGNQAALGLVANPLLGIFGWFLINGWQTQVVRVKAGDGSNRVGLVVHD